MPQLLFEALQRTAEGGLRHAQLVRGGADRAVGGDGVELTQLIKIHHMPPSTMGASSFGRRRIRGTYACHAYLAGHVALYPPARLPDTGRVRIGPGLTSADMGSAESAAVRMMRKELQ